MKWMKFAFQAFLPSFSLAMAQFSSPFWPHGFSIITGLLAHTSEVMGSSLPIELRGVGCKPHLITRKMFSSMKKVVDETGGQRGPYHHKKPWHAVSIHSIDSWESSENPCWRQTNLNLETFTSNGGQIPCLIPEFSVRVVQGISFFFFSFFQTLSFHLCDAELVPTEGWGRLSVGDAAHSILCNSKAAPRDNQDGKSGSAPRTVGEFLSSTSVSCFQLHNLKCYKRKWSMDWLSPEWLDPSEMTWGANKAVLASALGLPPLGPVLARDFGHCSRLQKASSLQVNLIIPWAHGPSLLPPDTFSTSSHFQGLAPPNQTLQAGSPTSHTASLGFFSFWHCLGERCWKEAEADGNGIPLLCKYLNGISF